MFFGLIQPICNCGNNWRICQSQWHKDRLIFGVSKKDHQSPDYPATHEEYMKKIKSLMANRG